MEERGKSNGRISKLPMTGTGVSVLLVSIAIAVTFLTVTPVGAQEANVTVTVKAPEYVGEGETFDVTIDVDSVTDFNSAWFDLSFDPSVVEVTGVTDGCIDDTVIPIYDEGDIDSGTIKKVTSGFPEEVDTKVSGTGYLAKITFEVIGEEGDECVLEISNGKLVKIVKTAKGGEQAEKTPAYWINAEVRIGVEEEEEEEEEEEGEPTPTPSTSPTPTDVTNATDVTNVTATPTPTLAPEVTPTPEAEGTPTPTPKEKTTPKPTAPPTEEKPTPTPTPTPKTPGFEAIFAIAVVGIAYIPLRRNPFSKEKGKRYKKNLGGDKKKK
jgi:hypothetical protein